MIRFAPALLLVVLATSASADERAADTRVYVEVVTERSTRFVATSRARACSMAGAPGPGALSTRTKRPVPSGLTVTVTWRGRSVAKTIGADSCRSASSNPAPPRAARPAAAAIST